MVIRPARLDRPVRLLAIDPKYSDPQLEEIIRISAERARESARAQGYAAGWSQGRQAASGRAALEAQVTQEQIAIEREDAGDRVTALLTALSESIRAARTQAMPEWAEIADVLATGALRLAAAALGRELQSVDGTIAQSVAQALRQIADPGDAVIHLNPAEVGLVDQEAAGVRVVADPNVDLGQVLVLTPAQRLCHDLPAALAAAEEVLKS